MKTFQKDFLRTSGQIARERTRLTVASDRLSCNQDELRQLQKEVMGVLSKYMNLDKEALKIRIDIVSGTKRGVHDVKTIQIK